MCVCMLLFWDHVRDRKRQRGGWGVGGGILKTIVIDIELKYKGVPNLCFNFLIWHTTLPPTNIG